jgi:hypothetical protein
LTSKSHIVLTVLQGLGIILLILLCLSAYFWNDDFHFYHEMDVIGNWKSSLNMYLTWDGRGLSLNGFWRNISVYYFSAYENAMLATFYLGIQAFLLWKIAAHVIDFRSKNIQQTIQITITFTFLLWLSFRSHIAYSHYWATGTIYAVQSIFFLWWIYIYLFAPQVKNWFFALITFVLVLGGVYSATAIFALALLDYVVYRRKWDSRLTYFLIAFIPAFGINVLAPGNYTRLDYIQDEPVTDVIQFTLNYFQILRRFIMTSLEAFAAGVLLAFSIPINKIKLDSYVHHRFWLLGLVAALASLLPFAIMPNAVINYLGMHFQVLVFVLTLTFGFAIRVKLELFRLPWIHGQVVATIVFLIIAFSQWQGSQDVYRQIQHRHIVLSAHQGRPDTVYLPPIRYNQNFFSHLSYEILEDADEAHNQRLQMIHQTGPVVLKIDGPSSADTIPYTKNYKLNNYLDRKHW